MIFLSFQLLCYFSIYYIYQDCSLHHHHFHLLFFLFACSSSAFAFFNGLRENGIRHRNFCFGLTFVLSRCHALKLCSPSEKHTLDIQKHIAHRTHPTMIYTHTFFHKRLKSSTNPYNNPYTGKKAQEKRMKTIFYQFFCTKHKHKLHLMSFNIIYVVFI